MPYPKTKEPRRREARPKALEGLQIKKQEDFPLFMCEFFEGFEVLQTRGKKSQEYIFGIYFGNAFCGHVYFGEKWTQQEAAQICRDIMPQDWNDIDKYVEQNIEKVWYWKMKADQYAWIYEKVITKIN